MAVQVRGDERAQLDVVVDHENQVAVPIAPCGLSGAPVMPSTVAQLTGGRPRRDSLQTLTLAAADFVLNERTGRHDGRLKSRGAMSQSADTQELQSRLGLSPRSRAWRWGRWILAGAGTRWGGRAAGSGVARPRARQYRTELVEAGTLTVTVTATGELKALTQVNIGTEISGVVESVAVDYNSPVRVGQVLARVNTEKLEAQAAQARAGLQSAEAKRLQAQATLAEAEADLARLQQVHDLSKGRVPSRQELESQDATVKRAQADEASTNAQVAQSQASLSGIETDIRKAVIRSPINGIVLDRQIDPGQTVAASFQTPTLFTLAEDLTKMRLIVDVDEADIGNVRVGQSARFRVDAYPDRVFESRVKEVRSTPKTSNGVVTYQTVLRWTTPSACCSPG